MYEDQLRREPATVTCAHVIGGNRFAVPVVGGASADDALSQVMAVRQIGERPVDDLQAGAADMRAACAVVVSTRERAGTELEPMWTGRSASPHSVPDRRLGGAGQTRSR